MKLLSLCAVLLLAGTMHASAQRTQTGQYCFTMPSGAQNCGFQTWDQCNKARHGVSMDICRPNPRAAKPRKR